MADDPDSIQITEESGGDSEAASVRGCFKDQFGSDCDGGSQGTVDRAFIGKKAVNTTGRVPIRFFRFQFQLDMNPPNNQYIFLEFHLTYRFRS